MKNLCKTVTLHFANKEFRRVLISSKVSDEEIKIMGLDEYFNLGSDTQIDMQKCIGIEIEH